MADISSAATPTDNTATALATIGTTAAPGSTVLLTIDTLVNPITGALVTGCGRIGTADIDAMIERAKIALFDAFGDNLV